MVNSDEDKVDWRLRLIEDRAREDRERAQRDYDRISAEVDNLKHDHITLKSDYEKMVSRSAGVFVAVLSIGAFAGWVISTLKDFFMRGHS